jgi:glycosyltransferase involved in cell wall biosynthesis
VQKVPLLIWSDSPSGPSGLARICRELASRLSMMPEFRVATIGYGAPGSRKLPFQQYAWTKGDDWIIRELQQVWDDFTEGEDGIIFSINDLGRMLWLTNPEQYPQEPVCQWLGKNSKRMRLWTYCPIDAEGPNGKLSFPLKHTLLGFKRVLLYSEWSRQIALRSGVDNTEALPHGIDTSVFFPRSHEGARFNFGERVLGTHHKIDKDHYLIGVVATNQHRKDWHLAFETAAILRDRYHKKVSIWMHTDAQERFWSLPTLMVDYGFTDFSKGPVYLTTDDLSDEQMGWGYSACDCLLAIGKGEGFSFTNFEALACGCPVLAGDYGGHAEHMPPWSLVHTRSWDHSGLYGEKRPVFNASDWASSLSQISRDFSGLELPIQLDWKNLWPRFEDWFKKGVR